MTKKESDGEWPIFELSVGRRRPFLCLAAESEWLTGPSHTIEQDVHRALLIHAIFGHYLFVSDQFLLTHPVALAMLEDENSLLREMLWTKFAKIVTMASNESEFLAAPSVAKSSPESIQLWATIVSPLWQRGDVVRMPRNRLEIGFIVPPDLDGQDDPRAVEFRKYSEKKFKDLTEPNLQPESDPVLGGKRRAIQRQISDYDSARDKELLTEPTPDVKLRSLSFELEGSDLLSISGMSSSFWNEPVAWVDPAILQTNLQAFKLFADPSKMRPSTAAKLKYATAFYRALHRDKFCGAAQLLQKTQKLTQKYLQGQKLTHIMVSGETEKEGWCPFTCREILPAVISARWSE